MAKIKITLFYFILTGLAFSIHANPHITFCGSESNDLYLLLKKQDIALQYYASIEDAIRNAKRKTAIIIVADNYPDHRVKIYPKTYKEAQRKGLRLYVEYPDFIPGYTQDTLQIVANLERGVVTSDFFGDSLPPLSLLGINDCHLYPINVSEPLISFAKVAGFDKAEYGLTDTDVYPLLFQEDNTLIAMSSLSTFLTNRFAPVDSWKIVWESILTWLTGETIALKEWTSDPIPSFAKNEILSPDARINSIQRGSDWFFKGKFLLHPSWKEQWLYYQSDGLTPFGPPVSKNFLVGNGSLGILEGHASKIYWNGKQQYRYWMRADVQGEAAFALASASALLNDRKYKEVSENLMDYLFYTSKFRSGARNNKDNPVYGLLGWTDTHPYVYYNDDNARAVLGAIGASAYLNNERWNKLIVENILANFRISSKQGFIGERLEEPQIEKEGWQHFSNRDFTNPHPHFESWMWACYLWLYDKTGHRPLLDKAKTGIRIMMEAYPDKWKWTNGIQQERARMVLCLAWLVRIEDTPQHRAWLDTIVQKLLENQQPSGAIREELGNSSGLFGKTPSNKAYGLHEAPLISENGDPVSDMLYSCNFAFFGLNEAAHATGNAQYKKAVEKLSDFMTRIQVRSNTHSDLDGAWFRAFDYNRWDYWASNADAGWGAWCTLTGWIQSWIIGTQVLVENNNSYWDITQKINMKKAMDDSIWMLEKSY